MSRGKCSKKLAALSCNRSSACKRLPSYDEHCRQLKFRRNPTEAACVADAREEPPPMAGMRSQTQTRDEYPPRGTNLLLFK
jgi:hypothetical protein